MTLVDDLKKLLECPCCLELPFPEDLSIGLCNNGHYVCLTCSSRILLRTDRCPLCRQPGFQIIRGFSFVVKTIQLLTNQLVYVCRHGNCNEQRSGNELLQHEKICRLKPVECPRLDCFYKGPIDQFLDDHHFPCVQVVKRQLPSPGWSFVIDLDMAYCFDTNTARVHEHFNPIILQGRCCRGEIESHAYVNMFYAQGTVIIFAGWLNKFEETSEAIQNIKIEMSVYVNSVSGKIGQFVAKRPKYQGDAVTHSTDGVSFARHTLYNWSEWSNATDCPECPNSVRKPHVHVKVGIKQI